jgi:hypothetical protein
MRLTLKGKNGSLHQFTQKVKNKRGEIVEYPKVRGGERSADNVRHWKWKLSYKDKVDSKWVTRCLTVPPTKVARVKRAIAENLGIDKIREFLS